MKSILYLILWMMISTNLWCQGNFQNSELKKIVNRTIIENKSEFQNQDTIYFQLPSFLISTSSSEIYSLKVKNEFVICLLNASEVFENEKIDYYYCLTLIQKKKDLIQLTKIIHPRVGIDRKFINGLNYRFEN